MTSAVRTTTRTSASARWPTLLVSTSCPAARVVAGDIGLIGRLSRAETGDTLSSL